MYIQNPVKHIRRNVLQKRFTAVICELFCKSLRLRCWQSFKCFFGTCYFEPNSRTISLQKRYHGPFLSLCTYNQIIWLNVSFTWIFPSNIIERVGCHESTRKLIKVRNIPCNNIMTLETRVTNSNLHGIPVSPS